MPVVSSFDVFDTVLVRRLGAPAAVFDQLGLELTEAGLLPGRTAAFVAARRAAERAVGNRLGRPATLAEIYDEVAAVLSAGPSVATKWVAAEEDLERRLVIALPGAREMVDKARSASELVIFVSDTPHREDLIRELLERAGLCADGDQVFTSAARGASKSAGGLFTAVRSQLGMPSTTTFHHTGDNPRSDLAAPRLEKWSSGLIIGGSLNRYETRLESHAITLGTTASWLAGASRIARLEAEDAGVAAPIAAVASGVLGPMLVGFALWVAAQAQARGVRRLYFVSRDGELMMRAAAPVLARLAPEVECRYLYGSRQPWRLAAGARSETELRRWLDVTSDFTPRTLAARVELIPEQVNDAAGVELIPLDRADQPLSADERRALADKLLQPPLLDVVRKRADEAERAMLGYLREAGLTDDVPVALVDAGWNGTTAKALDDVLATVGAPAPDHFLLGVTGKAAATLDEGHRLHAWLADGIKNPSVFNGFPALNVLVEMFCAGTEGRLLRYDTQPDGGVEPVLSEPANTAPLEWGLREMQAVAVRVAELVAPDLDAASSHADTTAMVWDVLRAFWLRPTRAEAQAWGTFPWEEEIAQPFSPVAQVLSTRDVLRRWRAGDHAIRRLNSWRAGSAAVSAEPWRAVLQLRAVQERSEDRLRRLPRRFRLELAKRRR